MAPANADGTTDLEAWLTDMETHCPAHATGMMTLLAESAAHQQGPKRFTERKVHLMDRENSIYEYIKGDLRVAFFYGTGNKIIICTHGFRKNSQKTPRAEKRIAIDIKSRYFTAIENGTIEITEENT